MKKECKGDATILRYADDFVCAFQYKEDAERFLDTLRDRLGKFHLELAPEKTRMMRFNRYKEPTNGAFEFLGFEFRCPKCHGRLTVCPLPVHARPP